MNPENKTPGMMKLLAGMLLGAMLAFLSPIVLMTEMLSLSVVLMLPSIALVALNRWAGKGPALFSAIMQIMVSSRFLGSAFMWMSFFLTLLPVSLLIRHENKPFFTQVKISITAFCTGVVLSVAFTYFSYGGNIMDQLLLELPKLLRTLPVENLEIVMASYSNLIGEAVGAEEFYLIFDQMINGMLPVYRMSLPGLIFAGALVSAVICIALNGSARIKQGIAVEGSYLPVREWFLPGSATSGLLLMLAVSYAMSALKMRSGETLFYTVYDITVAAFCIQAFASIARRMHASNTKRGARVAAFVVLALLCLLGAAMVISLYGIASAVFGSKGMVRERMERNNQNNNHIDGNE